MAQQRRNSQSGSGMTAKQRQAVLVLAVCALVLVITITAVSVWVSKSKKPNDIGDDPSSNIPESSSVVPSAFDPTKYGDAVLGETDDAGKEYIDQTLFVGDSNTNLYYQNALLTLDQVVAVEGLGIQNFTTDKSIYFKKDDNAYSIPEAIAKMKPRRIIMMMGTNNIDGTMSGSSFAESYKAAVDAIKAAYDYTDIIVAAVPPIPQDHSQYTNVSIEAVNEFNDALAQMCADNGLKFLNISEALVGADGYGKASCFRPGDVHLKKDGLTTILDYARTHAYLGTEDRRPDTNDIPARRTGTAGSSEIVNPTAKPEDKEEEKTFTAQYNVDKKGGTLESGDKKGVTSLSFKDLEEKSTITVTAVPDKGYEFVKWSDGKTDATRTDKKFKQNVNVSAMFAAEQGVKIKEGSSGTIEQGQTITLHAKAYGADIPDDKIAWTMDGKAVRNGYSAGFTPDKAGTYSIKATVTGTNGKTYSAEYKLTVTEKKVPVFKAEYGVSDSAMGYLESGDKKGAGLAFNDVKEGTPVSVKAVANAGYKFVKWSDDNPNATRTDYKAVSVNAIFEAEAHVHDYKLESEVKPTCTESGKKVLACSCGDRKEESVPALGHAWEVTGETAPTCTTEGEKQYKCKNCGATKSEKVPVVPHNPGAWEQTVAPQVGVPGKEVQKCTVCGTVLNEREIPALPAPESPEGGEGTEGGTR